jgi:hypothetical protein
MKYLPSFIIMSLWKKRKFGPNMVEYENSDRSCNIARLKTEIVCLIPEYYPG